MPTIGSRSDLKTYLGITTSGDDTLLDQITEDATGIMQSDTGRVFAVSSNVRRVYSTDGQASIRVHDRPVVDPTRTVTLYGAALSEVSGQESVWFLPDWNDPTVSTTVQLRYFDTGRPDWYKADPEWFEKNLDRWASASSSPNDLVITGIEGHGPIPDAVFAMWEKLAALLYWQAKAGASGFVQTPTGQEIDVTADRPEGYAMFVNEWRLRTAVVKV